MTFPSALIKTDQQIRSTIKGNRTNKLSQTFCQRVQYVQTRRENMEGSASNARQYANNANNSEANNVP